MEYQVEVPELAHFCYSPKSALSAAKTKAWHPLYEHYRGKGLSSTAVLVILARRIARTAWSIYTHKTEFDSKRLISALT